MAFPWHADKANALMTTSGCGPLSMQYLEGTGLKIGEIVPFLSIQEGPQLIYCNIFFPFWFGPVSLKIQLLEGAISFVCSILVYPTVSIMSDLLFIAFYSWNFYAGHILSSFWFLGCRHDLLWVTLQEKEIT